MSIPAEFIVEKMGRKFILFNGLLHEAHNQGLKRIETSILQFPSTENASTCICHAIVETEKGTFSGIGDANASNVSRGILPHYIRLAETRSIARALRFAINAPAAALEELGPDAVDVDDAEPHDAPSRREPTPIRREERTREGQLAAARQTLGNAERASGMARPTPQPTATSNIDPGTYRPLQDTGIQDTGEKCTDTQFTTIGKLLTRLGRGVEPIPANLTRSQASDMITRLSDEWNKRPKPQAPGRG